MYKVKDKEDLGEELAQLQDGARVIIYLQGKLWAKSVYKIKIRSKSQQYPDQE
jgi:hypothetical protein